nr:NADH dehydrogenase subunit 2 [Metallyticus sp. JZ-2017]
MPNNSTKILFLLTLMSGILISLSSNSWVGAWMGLEINLFSFIPLLVNNSNMISTESSLKYFLIQSISSSTLLFLILIKSNIQEMIKFNMNMWNNLIITPLLMKVAASPFHWWLPSVMEGLSWMNCFILLSLQKIAPVMLISYMIINNSYTQFIILTSAIMGSIGGFNQTSLRKILAFSSINHISWMLITMIMGSNFWMFYFIIYTLNIVTIISMFQKINSTYISQIFNTINFSKEMKVLILMSLLSLGGLPPFLGFFPKWITIQLMSQNFLPITMTTMIMCSLLTLFYYMRMMYPILMIQNNENFWMTKNTKPFTFKFLITNLSIILLGMMISSLFTIVY